MEAEINFTVSLINDIGDKYEVINLTKGDTVEVLKHDTRTNKILIKHEKVTGWVHYVAIDPNYIEPEWKPGSAGGG